MASSLSSAVAPVEETSADDTGGAGAPPSNRELPATGGAESQAEEEAAKLANQCVTKKGSS